MEADNAIDAHTHLVTGEESAFFRCSLTASEDDARGYEGFPDHNFKRLADHQIQRFTKFYKIKCLPDEKVELFSLPSFRLYGLMDRNGRSTHSILTGRCLKLSPTENAEKQVELKKGQNSRYAVANRARERRMTVAEKPRGGRAKGQIKSRRRRKKYERKSRRIGDITSITVRPGEDNICLDYPTLSQETLQSPPTLIALATADTTFQSELQSELGPRDEEDFTLDGLDMDDFLLEGFVTESEQPIMSEMLAIQVKHNDFSDSVSHILDQAQGTEGLSFDLTEQFLDWTDFYQPDTQLQACISTMIDAPDTTLHLGLFDSIP